jgi:hypothetical protein
MVWLPSDWDKPEKTAHKLSEFWRSLGLRDKVVISSMAGHAVIIKRVTFSFGSEKELAEIINRDFKQYIPYDMKDVYYDYQVMGERARRTRPTRSPSSPARGRWSTTSKTCSPDAGWALRSSTSTLSP